MHFSNEVNQKNKHNSIYYSSFASELTRFTIMLIVWYDHNLHFLLKWLHGDHVFFLALTWAHIW